ncbi:MAG TPA: hypothetical protein VKN14_05450 [Flavobacteriaceae bacterium]|nr:hypothetical protein [Flavobacteriaceae bacterium]
MKLRYLIGDWQSPKGNIWIVRKAHDRSNTYLNIEFRIMTKYPEPFGFTSDCFDHERWNRFDSESFEEMANERQLIKLENK